MTIEPIALIETRVTVGPSHIALGHRHRCYSCPLALAIDDMLINGYKALIAPAKFVIHEARFILRNHASIPDTHRVTIPLPPAAIQFVADFDDKRPVSPKVFTIPLPRHLLRNPTPPMEVRS